MNATESYHAWLCTQDADYREAVDDVLFQTAQTPLSLTPLERDFDYRRNAEVCDAIREMLKGFASIGGINSVDAYNLALAGAEVQREYDRKNGTPLEREGDDEACEPDQHTEAMEAIELQEYLDERNQ